MTIQAWSSPIDHFTDAGFRAWGLDYSTHLALVGLVQTADTGQINWATVVKPALGTVGGYEIWRFNDSLQGTAPIFIKLEFGTGTANAPAMWITIGTGSSGAGAITGLATTRQALHYGSSSSSASSSPSFFCHTQGHLGVLSHVGFLNASYTFGSFIIGRYSDDDGTPNGNGFITHNNGATNPSQTVMVYSGTQSIRTAAPAQVFPWRGDSNGGYGTYGMWPSSTSGSSTIPTGEIQIIPFWYATRQFQQAFNMCGVLNGEVGQGVTFTTVVKGSTPRTFIGCGPAMGIGGLGATDSRHAMLWE